MTERRDERSLHTRGLPLLAIAALALILAAALPFFDVPLGASEALLLVAVPCALIGLIRRYARH